MQAGADRGTGKEEDMTDEDRRREAFRQADAILGLDGLEKPPGMDAIQHAVIEGRMSCKEAVSTIVRAEKARAGRRA